VQVAIARIEVVDDDDDDGVDDDDAGTVAVAVVEEVAELDVVVAVLAIFGPFEQAVRASVAANTPHVRARRRTVPRHGDEADEADEGGDADEGECDKVGMLPVTDIERGSNDPGACRLGGARCNREISSHFPARPGSTVNRGC
jgi:hypothetical protein